MTTSDERALTLLHALLQAYRDAIDAYASVDRGLPDPDLGRELARYQQQRLRLMADVEERIRDLRGTPDTVANTLSDRNVNDSTDASELLHEVERKEDSAVDVLRQGLKEQEVDEVTQALLQHHYEQVQAAHDRVRQLRNRAMAAQ